MSHDRTFLDNLVTQTIAFEGDGKLLEYAGGYEDWKRAQRLRTAPPREKKADARHAAKPTIKPSAGVAARVKLSFRERRELAALPDRISALEKEQAALSHRLGEPALYRGEPAQVKVLRARLAEIEIELARDIARWEQLETRNDAAVK